MTDAMLPPPFTPWPTPLTSLVGRERDIDVIASLLQQPGVRLVTLTGPGGVGKTRLALAVATMLLPNFLDGIALVGLAPVRDSTLVASAIAHALGAAESGDEQPVAALVATLGRAPMLLVLDNFEQVLEAAPLVVTLLNACPRLTILVTSRAALHVSGEREYPVPPLAVPATDASQPGAIAGSLAVRLFVERALAVDPGFHLTDDNAAAIAAICSRLDGLPLAIELAAARSKVLPPALLLPRLSRRLPLLTGGPRDVPARLQTMQEAITWSHDLLTVEEQALFRRLGVFVGGFTLEAAESVCGSITETLEPSSPPVATVLDGIASLVDKSLLQGNAGQGRERCLGMLETIREFALERLDAAGEGEAARAAHASYFGTLVKRFNPNRFGSGERVDDRLQHLEAEMPNLRGAFTHLADADDPESVLRLASGLAVFWQLRGYLREGQHWLEWGLTHGAELPAESRGLGLTGLALIRWSQGDRAQAASLAEEALTVANHLEDREIAAAAVHTLGLVAEAQQRWTEAEPLLEHSLAAWRMLGDKSAEAMTLHLLGDVAYGLGDRERSASCSEASLALFRAIGHAAGAGLPLCRLAVLARDARDDHRAVLTYHEALHLWSGVQDRWFIMLALTGLAELAAAYGQAQAAATLLGSIDALAETTGAPLFHTARINYDRAAAAAHVALPDERFDALYATGRRLRLDDASALAMAISVPDPTRVATNGPESTPSAHILTPREIEVLRLLIAGRTDREIAAALFIGRRTAQDHVSNIIAKLGVANRTEAAVAAVRDRLI